MTIPAPFWSRRAWLARTGGSAALVALAPRLTSWPAPGRATPSHPLWPELPTTASLPPGPAQALALRAVDAAKSAGAQYADVRLTRVVVHDYNCQRSVNFTGDTELVAVGVRALVNGYWGFAASPFWTEDEVVQLARNAVAQATIDAKGPPRTVELGALLTVTGTWATPVRIDPFSISIEEKRDYIQYWRSLAEHHHVPFYYDGYYSHLRFVRQERVVATSEGSLVTQTCYETSGNIELGLGGTGGIPKLSPSQKDIVPVSLEGLEVAGKGWELFLDANIPEQIRQAQHQIGKDTSLPSKPAVVGRYTLVCDGATMASLLNATLGVATQIDRALGYEANAGGTSFIEDPLGALGALQVASPLVTITANRSAPAQLATVKWDDECVAPPDFTLVKDGIVADFQTTREQAAWLAPYYAKASRPVRSNGCAASETGLTITMQHVPNLAMAPGASAVELMDLVKNVQHGILIAGGEANCDWQGRSGTLMVASDPPRRVMREIKNGRLGPVLSYGAVLFDAVDFWKHVTAIGGPATQGGIDITQYALEDLRERKGQPGQVTSHSVRAVAAIITNQAVINPTSRA